MQKSFLTPENTQISVELCAETHTHTLIQTHTHTYGLQSGLFSHFQARLGGRSGDPKIDGLHPYPHLDSK